MIKLNNILAIISYQQLFPSINKPTPKSKIDVSTKVAVHIYILLPSIKPSIKQRIEKNHIKTCKASAIKSGVLPILSDKLNFTPIPNQIKPSTYKAANAIRAFNRYLLIKALIIKNHTLSITAAYPCPTPIHMVTRA
jgi:hypothetical protein